MKPVLRAALVAGVSLMFATGALAHTSYLLPNYFSITEGKMITLEGGFA
jgi:hypothetical protein